MAVPQVQEDHGEDRQQQDEDVGDQQQIADARRVRPRHSAQPVADAVDGLDRVGADVAELAPQAADVAVDRALGDVVAVAVGAVDQLAARVHPAGRAHQRAQQTELGHREDDRGLAPEALVALRVERQLAAPQRRLARLARRVRPARRSSAFTRATSSRGLNGLVT